MKVDGNYNNIHSIRASESKGVQHKECKRNEQNNQKPKVDTFERSTPEDARYTNYADTYHQYVQACYSALYQQKLERLTPNDELKIEASKDKHSKVENTSESNPTHNNESHHYNQDSNQDRDESEEKKDKD